VIRKTVALIGVLTVIGVLAAAPAYAWNNNGNNNGWDNKNVRGCPTDFPLVLPASEDPRVDLNGDGLICSKQTNNGVFTDVDNTSNHPLPS
jgi:hypothetical protein